MMSILNMIPADKRAEGQLHRQPLSNAATMPTRRWYFVASVGLALGLGGCGPSSAARLAETTPQTSGELAGDSECSDDKLYSSPGSVAVCSGSWRYVTYDCFNEGVSLERCGASGRYAQMKMPASCESSSFGLRGYQIQAINSDQDMGYTPDQVVNNVLDSALRQCQARVATDARNNLRADARGLCTNLDYKSLEMTSRGGLSYHFQVSNLFLFPLYNQRVDAHRCGFKSCGASLGKVVPKHCANPRFGIRGYVRQASTRHYIFIATPAQTPFQQAYQMCKAEAAADGVESVPPGRFTVCYEGRETKTTAGPVNFWVEYDFDVETYTPFFNERDDATVCGEEVCVDTIGDDLSKPLGAMCRDAVFGRAPSNVCGAMETVHYSAAGLPRTSLPTETRWAWDGSIGAAECVTDDFMHLSMPGGSAAKYARLQRRLETLREEAATGMLTGPTQLQIVKRLKLLFELHGLELDRAQRQHAAGLYRLYPTADLCGKPANSVDGDSGLAMCERMLGRHVPQELAASYVDICRDLASRNFSEDSEDLVTRLQERAVGAHL